MFADPLPDWVNTTSPRVGAGLGTIARVVTSGEAIYRGKLRFAEAQARVRECWQPYHDALAGLLAANPGAVRTLPAAGLPLHARRPGPLQRTGLRAG